MGAPWTQAYIQAKIDYYADAGETAANSQEYSYDQGQVGEFSLKKGNLKDIDAIMEKWITRMEKYYPNAFAVQPQIVFNEIGYLNG